VLAYGARKLDMWWQQNADALARHRNLEVLTLSDAESSQLAELAERSMQLSCTVQEGNAWIGSGRSGVAVEIKHLKRP
jgi:uncharacterized protein YaeQ